MSYRKWCKRLRLCLLFVIEQMPSLQKGGRMVGDEGGDSGYGSGQHTSDTIEISFALFLQGRAFPLEPGLEGIRGYGLRDRDGRGVTHALNFTSSSANSWSTVRSIWPVFCRSWVANQERIRFQRQGLSRCKCDALRCLPG